MDTKTRNTTVAGVFMVAACLLAIVGFSDALSGFTDKAAEQTKESSQMTVKNITKTVNAQGGGCGGSYGQDLDGDGDCERSGSTTYTVVLAEGSVNAQCDVSPQSVPAGSQVTYDGSGSTASSSIVAYGWNFGDGDTATTTDPIKNYTYNTINTYDGSLTVVSSNGNSETVDCPDVTVTNTCPSPNNYSNTIEPGETLNDSVSATDDNGDSLSYSLVAGTDPSIGTLSFNSDGSFEYNHPGGSTTTQSFKFEVDDGECTKQGTATININNQPPTAVINGPSNADYCQFASFDGSGSYDNDDGGASITSYSWAPSSRLQSTSGTNIDTSQILWTDPTDIQLSVEDDEGASDLETQELTVDTPGYDANIIVPDDTPKRLWMTASSTNRSTKATIEVSDIEGNSEFAGNYSFSDLTLTFPDTSGIPTSTIVTNRDNSANTFQFWINPQNQSEELAFGTYDITAAVGLGGLGGGYCVYDKETVEIDLRAQTTSEF